MSYQYIFPLADIFYLGGHLKLKSIFIVQHAHRFYFNFPLSELYLIGCFQLVTEIKNTAVTTSQKSIIMFTFLNMSHISP
jgi:hypothetical protein